MGGFSEKGPGINLTGFIIVLVGNLLASAILIAEEFVLIKYRAHPLRMVGWMGVYEFPVLAIILIILNFIPCSNPTFCRYGYPEDIWLAFK